MAGEDPNYQSWIRRQSCCSCAGSGGEIHHRTGAGLALRAHDHEGMPMCSRCHRCFHDLNGPFKGWQKNDLRSFQEMMVNRYRDRYSEIQEAL